MTFRDERWTRSGVRLRAYSRHDGALNWLFLPGGPGIGSESLEGLVDAADVPGTSWLVDLPGDGSNIDAPGAAADPYADWPAVFVEAARAVANPVVVGHSTGGMYLLSIPELEGLVRGLALVSSAPDARWLPAYEHMTTQHPLPEVDHAVAVYDAHPGPATLRDLAVASAPWNFTPHGLAAGVDLLGRMPYNPDAVLWSDENFDATYQSKWWPATTPTLIVSGAEDRVVAQDLWTDPRYQGANITHHTVDGAGHFPWIDRPDQLRDAFRALAVAVSDAADREAAGRHPR